MTEPEYESVPAGTMPYHEGAEKAVLGGILLVNEHLMAVIQILKPSDFYLLAHRRIYAAMLSIFERGGNIDPILLAEELKKDAAVESVGGIPGITNLTYGLPVFSTTSMVNYAVTVKEKSNVRSLITNMNKVVADALAEDQDVDTMIDRAEQYIFDLLHRGSSNDFQHIQPLLENAIEKVQTIARQEGARSITGLATGFRDFDQMTSGLQKTDLIILAARPSMGKTALALTIAENAAIIEQAVVAVFSLEMSKEQLVMRLMSSMAKVDAHRFRNGYLTADEWTRLGNAFSDLEKMEIHIDDTPMIGVQEMRTKSRRLAAEKKRLDLIIVDYLQLMGGGRAENRQQEVAKIARDLKQMAKELNCPVIALSQLSRANEKRTDKRPQLGDLRESGAIEQDADLVGFIYREELYKPDEANMGQAEIIIAKQRNGPTGTFNLAFLKEFTRFENLWQDVNYRI